MLRIANFRSKTMQTVYLCLLISHNIQKAKTRYIRGKQMFYTHENYKGGTNNLLIVFDSEGNYATSLKNFYTAEKNLKAKIRRRNKQDEERLL